MRTFPRISISLLLFHALNILVRAQNYGSMTCLEGWVWREAFANDYVCVTPATRSQTAIDNKLAASRVNPNGGPYGSKTCLNGYVWREASPTDYVCVTPATRAQAAEDNSQAANRCASLNIWTSTFTDPSIPGKFCIDGVCTTPLGVQVHGDHFNFGTVTVGIYGTNNDQPIKPEITLTASSNPPLVAGSFSVHFDVANCPGIISSFPSAYIQAYDSMSTRWSNKTGIYTYCLAD